MEFDFESYCGWPDEDCETNNPALAAWMKVHNELFSRRPVPDEVWRVVPTLVSKWISTKNPHYLDYVQLLLAKHRFNPTETISGELLKAAALRVSGSPAGTPEEVQRFAAKSVIYLWMAHLVAAGSTLSRASEVAAELYKLHYPKIKPIKASTLEKNYAGAVRTQVLHGKTNEEIILEIHKKDPDLSEMWKILDRNTQLSDSSLRGERR